MRLIPISILSLLLFGCSNSSSSTNAPWTDASFETVLAKADADTPLLMEYYTDWCSWCKKLNAETFTDSSVIDFMQEHYVATKIDAEKGEGIDLAKRYAVSGYPTVVIVDQEGKEIDRIIGYAPADSYLEELQRIYNNEGTVADLITKTRENPHDLEIWEKLAQKYEDRSDWQNAYNVWDIIAKLPGEKADYAEFKLTTLHARLDESFYPLLDYIQTHNNSDYVKDAYKAALSLARNHASKDMEAEIYVDYLAYMEANDQVTTQLLNGFSWRMTQLELNLEIALKYVRRAVEMVKDESAETRAQIMDTEAEVLWKMGRTGEAIAVIEQCIELQPEDEYYQEQKAKFEQSA